MAQCKINPSPIVPVRMDETSAFSFQCDRELACFTKCCHNLHIYLTPFDILRMKHRLELSSAEFLNLYTVPDVIPGTELPIPVLKTLDEPENPCPFVRKDGCIIYEDRPVSCRYYPVGAGIFHNRDEATDERFFAMIKEPHCLGHGMAAERTVAEWLNDQGVKPYEEKNAGWVDIILRRKSLGPFITLPDNTLKMFFMASYNLDVFRIFVLESVFLNVYDVPEELVERLKTDDEALLAFAYDWMQTTLLGARKIPLKKKTATVMV